MLTAHDLLTRVPALDAGARHARLRDTFHIWPGSLAGAMDASRAGAERAADGLWRLDASTWSADPTVQKEIANRLGWLRSPLAMADSIDRLRTFAASIRSDGFTDVVLLGMGGSSLAPEVLRAIVGTAPGWPRFHMLDSTDPAAIRAATTPPDRTLYILASKSGTTIEPNSLAAHFRTHLEAARVPRWADHFVAITDEGTPLAERARSERFRDVFINPTDIGGRYSALSFFGLVPSALMGQDVAALLGWGVAMLAPPEPDAASRSAIDLGLLMGAGGANGRDKLTLLVPPSLEPFGLWVEQLVAESTGKAGVGVVPIAGETAAEPTQYGNDRAFVRLHFPPQANDSLLEALKAGKKPIADIQLPEPLALGAEFVRWEIATAIAGTLLRINPFDEPNVQQAKDATKVLLDQFKATGALPQRAPDRTLPRGVTLTLSSAASRALKDRGPEAFLSLLADGDYLGLLAYVGPDEALANALRSFRLAVRDRSRCATMFGYGPRYLHSTGQLHKGGPTSGVFVLITAAPTADLPIPGAAFSFATLEMAQALGDFASLDATGRRAVHVHLPSADPQLIRDVADAFLEGSG